jgi:hypothetical protein
LPRESWNSGAPVKAKLSGRQRERGNGTVRGRYSGAEESLVGTSVFISCSIPAHQNPHDDVMDDEMLKFYFR